MTPIEWLFILAGGGYLIYKGGTTTGSNTAARNADVVGEFSNIQRYVTQAGGISPASKTILLDNLSQLEAMVESGGVSSAQPIVSSGGGGGVVITVPVNSGSPGGTSSTGGGQGSSGLGGLGNALGGLGNALGGSGGSSGGDTSGGSGDTTDPGSSSDFTE